MIDQPEETIAEDAVEEASDTVEEAPDTVESDTVGSDPVESDAVEDVADVPEIVEDVSVEEAESAEDVSANDDDTEEAVDAVVETESAETQTDETEDEAAEEEPAPPVKSKSPYDRPGRWYVLHTQSGYENKVKTNLEARAQSMNMEHRIFEVVIPLEDVVEFKNGKKVVVQKKVFPGYLLARIHLDDDSWFVVRNTPGVTGFAGAGNTPVPMRRSEVEQHLAVKDEAEDTSRKGRPRLEYGMGETVRVKEGPFADFQGEIVEINEDQLKVKVLVNIFGRETPVELEFAQVGKV